MLMLMLMLMLICLMLNINASVLLGLNKTSLLSAPSTVSMFVPAPEDFSDEQPTNMADRWIYLFVTVNITLSYTLLCSFFSEVL